MNIRCKTLASVQSLELYCVVWDNKIFEIKKNIYIIVEKALLNSLRCVILLYLKLVAVLLYTCSNNNSQEMPRPNHQ